MPFSVNFVCCVAGSGAGGEQSDCCPPQAVAPVDIFLPGKEAIGWAIVEELEALSAQSGDTPELREAFSKTECGQLVGKVHLGFVSYPAGICIPPTEHYIIVVAAELSVKSEAVFGATSQALISSTHTCTQANVDQQMHEADYLIQEAKQLISCLWARLTQCGRTLMKRRNLGAHMAPGGRRPLITSTGEKHPSVVASAQSLSSTGLDTILDIPLKSQAEPKTTS